LAATEASDLAADSSATPERIASYYDVVQPSQYPRISVPACLATPRIQNTSYLLVSSSWPRHHLFERNSNISYIKTEASPVYETLTTKNWTVVKTTWSNTHSTPVNSRTIVGDDNERIAIVYTPYPLLDPSDYAVAERERQILKDSRETVEYVDSTVRENYVMVPSSVVRKELCRREYGGKSVKGSGFQPNFGSLVQMSVVENSAFLDVKPVIAQIPVRAVVNVPSQLVLLQLCLKIFQ